MATSAEPARQKKDHSMACPEPGERRRKHTRHQHNVPSDSVHVPRSTAALAQTQFELKCKPRTVLKLKRASPDWRRKREVSTISFGPIVTFSTQRMRRPAELLMAILPILLVGHAAGFLARTGRSVGTAIFLKDKWFAPDEPSNNEEELVTREMLLRDMLEDPQVKRKRRNKKGQSSYKPLDNRDHLPFSVRKITPDPYTHPEKKKSKAKSAKTKRTDLDKMASSRLIMKGQDGTDVTTHLGDFKLDKTTNSGDVIVIGTREYEVQKARCQYKYAGGSRFVMVRKILEVKEVARVADEEFLTRQYKQSESPSDKPPNLQ